MNRAKLKNYAPQARREFIQAVTDRAAYYGLTPKKAEAIIEKGDVALIAGRAFPRSVVQKRRALEDRISRHGFEQVMEMMAYTWFNRFVAIRFMELHGYLDHGYRVVSHPEGKAIPEILEHAEHVDLPGLDRNKVIELKLEGTKEDELYRLILIAQCNALHSAMPFLFEWINDETELLLPDNLLHSDSLIRKLVNEIDEEDWNEVEIIGWLYESYISEKKDEVIGKIVRSEDIPAATQRFTPNWIVKYMVQNTLGRQWLATYPNSALRQQMAYYIEPAEQTLEVQAQLKAITPESLNPEEITFLDDACGSGHILVEAYDLFKLIYQERGYRAKDIPRLILKKNLYGLEIDDRAAQLSSLALMMKARADDHRILSSNIQPNVVAIQESKGLNANEITNALTSSLEREGAKGQEGYISQADISQLIELFKNGKTFGSLIRVSENLARKLPQMAQKVTELHVNGDLFSRSVSSSFLMLVKQAQLLSNKYSVVVTNPPYMGSSFYNPDLKLFVEANYDKAAGDLYSCFITRNLFYAVDNGYVGMITIPNWMFLSTFRELRTYLYTHQTIITLVHNGRGVWGSDFGSCSFVIQNTSQPDYCGRYRRLFEKQGSVASNEELIERFYVTQDFLVASKDFMKVPGEPLTYWASERVRNIFLSAPSLKSIATPRRGLATGDNERFIRQWWEVSLSNSLLGSATNTYPSLTKWFSYNKGGEFRKWFGNAEYVINWLDNGHEIRHLFDAEGRLRSRPQGIEYNFKPVISWSSVSISFFGVRLYPSGFINDQAGNFLYLEDDRKRLLLLAFLCSKLSPLFLSTLNLSLNILVGDICNFPVLLDMGARIEDQITNISSRLVAIAEADWDSFETSWNFKTLLLLTVARKVRTVREAWENWDRSSVQNILTARALEENNNKLFIQAYGLENEVLPDVSEDQITLSRPDRRQDTKRLISYAIGCIMGRYSLDKPGLIYAHSKNTGFDPNQYMTFPADQDGIIPVMEGEWFSHDATDRFVEFITALWPGEYLEENLKFIAESLGPNGSEGPRQTIRHYLAIGFFKDHLKTYKRRPIYWLFSSGKLRAFQCLVYLHRYNEGTLSRMRTEYVIPLQGKIASRIEQLSNDIQNATSTSRRRKMEKERDTLIKQQAELQSFDEKLRHYADLRIRSDLDDGVKVNYGKFGDLLAEVKSVTGGGNE